MKKKLHLTDLSENLQYFIHNSTLEELARYKLENFIEKVDSLTFHNLQKKVLEQVEKPLIQTVLRKTNYNQLKAAKALGLNRNTLRKKIEQLRIKTKK